MRRHPDVGQEGCGDAAVEPPPRPLRVARADGGAIVGDVRGPDHGPTVLLLHGLGQTRHSWRRAAAVLAARGVRAVTIDLRGHGDSDWARPPGTYAVDELVDDAARVVDALGPPLAAVGASLGGFVALLLHADVAPHLSAIVLVDIAPRVEPDGASRIRTFMQGTRHGFDSLDDAAAAVARYLPGRANAGRADGLAKNLRPAPGGRWRWHWDPALLDRPPLDGVPAARIERAAASLAIPTLLVRGAESDVLSEQGVDELRALVPHAEVATVGGATHMVAGDENDAFTTSVVPFLGRALDLGAASR